LEIKNQNTVLKNSFPEHGLEIEEIISKKPTHLVRWGTLYLFLFILFVGLICWFVRYPEITDAKARLNSINAPKEVISKIDGKLEKLLVENGQDVQLNALLGYMESVGDPKAIDQIRTQAESVATLISENRTNEIISKISADVDQELVGELGELQPAFQKFNQSFISFRDFIGRGFYLRKRNMLGTDMSNLMRQHNILMQQKNLLEKDLSLSNETFKANKSLVKDKVISDAEYRDQESKLISKQLTLPEISSAIVSNESQQNEKRKEIAELENQISIQKNNFIQELRTFLSQIELWEREHVLRAPVAGKLVYGGFLQEDQQLKNGQLLFYVQPANASYFVEMLIPQYNFGRIEKGQEVLLKFQAYPYEQFGMVRGRIDYISSIPTDSGFQSKVILPQGLSTNMNKVLNYQNGLIADAQIVTQDTRLAERFFYNIRRSFSR